MAEIRIHEKRDFMGKNVHYSECDADPAECELELYTEKEQNRSTGRCDYRCKKNKLQKKLMMPLTDILAECGEKVDSPLDLLDREYMKTIGNKKKYLESIIDPTGPIVEGHWGFDNEKILKKVDEKALRAMADGYNKYIAGSASIFAQMNCYMDRYPELSKIDRAEYATLCLPIKKEYTEKINNWIFNNIRNYARKQRKIYRGLYANDEFINEIMKDGLRPGGKNPMTAKAMPLTPVREIAKGFGSRTIFEIDPKGLELIPVRYGNGYKGADEFVMFRSEAEVRATYVPPENIKVIHIFKMEDSLPKKHDLLGEKHDN